MNAVLDGLVVLVVGDGDRGGRILHVHLVRIVVVLEPIEIVKVEKASTQRENQFYLCVRLWCN